MSFCLWRGSWQGKVGREPFHFLARMCGHAVNSVVIVGVGRHDIIYIRSYLRYNEAISWQQGATTISLVLSAQSDLSIKMGLCHCCFEALD